jgi:hypothetical protein
MMDVGLRDGARAQEGRLAAGARAEGRPAAGARAGWEAGGTRARGASRQRGARVSVFAGTAPHPDSLFPFFMCDGGHDLSHGR